LARDKKQPTLWRGVVRKVTHYLRGRALGLLGRLEEARNEMNQVLALDPDNVDAQRGLHMIEAAYRPKECKRWWQFWKP
jgi:hypothetical protein